LDKGIERTERVQLLEEDGAARREESRFREDGYGHPPQERETHLICSIARPRLPQIDLNLTKSATMIWPVGKGPWLHGQIFGALCSDKNIKPTLRPRMTESDKAVWAGVGVDVGRKLDASKASMALSSVCIRVRIVGGRSVGWWWSVEVGQTFHHLFRCSLLDGAEGWGRTIESEDWRKHIPYSSWQPPFP
jgi:hypothetical protein